MKRKKIIIVNISVLFSLFVIWQVFSVYMHKGNLSFTIFNYTRNFDDNYNYTEPDSVFIEIYIDGNKIVAEQQLSHWPYIYHSMWISPKNHVAVVKINGDVSQEIKFNTILFTDILVNYCGDSIYNDNEDEIRFRIRISKWLIHFLA